MLHAQAQTPASTFLSRFNTISPIERSRSYDATDNNNNKAGEEDTESEVTSSTSDIRRATSLRNPGRIIDSRKDVASLSSFTAAGSTLNASPSLIGVSDQPSTSRRVPGIPPLASRHALFSHHRIVSSPVSSTPGPNRDLGVSEPMSIHGQHFSEPDQRLSSPPSPSPSSVSSSAFSPASAFLSHFSSNSSLRPNSSIKIPPDGLGARVLSYTLGKVLGRGGFSTVRLATKDDGSLYACKIVKRDDLSDQSGSLIKFEEEIKIWRSLPNHPSLLPLLEMERTDYATFLITPLLPGGNLLDVLRKEGGSDKTARKWVPGILKAVAAMHNGFPGFNGNLLHGDLKLDNFLVDHEGRVVAGDFYMAKLLDQQDEMVPTIPLPQPKKARTSLPSTTLGETSPLPSPLPSHFPSASLPYAAPELLQAPPAQPALPQDIWALGVCIHALLVGKLPFVDSFDPRLQMKILRGQWNEPDHLGREWIELLRGCLNNDPRSRWDVRKVLECDAVVGWKEVKQRSRSRSKTRGISRDGIEFGADPLTSQRRAGSRSRTREGEGSRNLVVGGFEGTGRNRNGRSSSRGLRDSHLGGPEQFGESSQSRSRSSGRGGGGRGLSQTPINRKGSRDSPGGVFEMDGQDDYLEHSDHQPRYSGSINTSMENLNIQQQLSRGRAQYKSHLSQDELQFTRKPTPHTSQSRERERERSRDQREREKVSTSPSNLTRVLYQRNATQRDGSPSSNSRSGSRSRQTIASTSPSDSTLALTPTSHDSASSSSVWNKHDNYSTHKEWSTRMIEDRDRDRDESGGGSGSGSRSRSRNHTPNWEERYEGGHLGVIDESSTGRGRTGRLIGRRDGDGEDKASRSRSRGRKLG